MLCPILWRNFCSQFVPKYFVISPCIMLTNTIFFFESDNSKADETFGSFIALGNQTIGYSHFPEISSLHLYSFFLGVIINERNFVMTMQVFHSNAQYIFNNTAYTKSHTTLLLASGPLPRQVKAHSLLSASSPSWARCCFRHGHACHGENWWGWAYQMIFLWTCPQFRNWN